MQGGKFSKLFPVEQLSVFFELNPEVEKQLVKSVPFSLSHSCSSPLPFLYLSWSFPVPSLSHSCMLSPRPSSVSLSHSCSLSVPTLSLCLTALILAPFCPTFVLTLSHLSHSCFPPSVFLYVSLLLSPPSVSQFRSCSPSFPPVGLLLLPVNLSVSSYSHTSLFLSFSFCLLCPLPPSLLLALCSLRRLTESRFFNTS